MCGSDFYEGEQVLTQFEKTESNLPELGIGKNCLIEKAIIDKNVRIGDNVEIRAKADSMPEFKGKNHWIKNGITIIPKGAVIPSGTII